MAVTEKAEQAVTRRPDSFVPARAMLTMLGRSPGERDRPVVPNHLMHYATAAAVGSLRGVWAATGIRGAHATAWHGVVRLAVDQTVENATGAGAPPATWTTQERVVDLLHKSVYAAVTGAVAERLVSPDLLSTRGRTSH